MSPVKKIVVSGSLILLIAIGVMVVVAQRNSAVPSNQEARPASDAAIAVKKPKIRRPQTIKNVPLKEMLEAGDQLAFKGDLNAALEQYKTASQGFPQEILPYIKVGDVLLSQRSYEEAKQNFTFALQQAPKNEDLTIKLMRSFIGLRTMGEAKSLADSLDESTQVGQYYRGVFAAFLNDEKSAVEFFKKVTEIGTDENLKRIAHDFLATYDELALSRDAPIEYRQTVLAFQFNKAELYGIAIELSFSALKQEHDYRDAWLILGHSFLNEHRWFDAEDAFSRVIQLDASNAASYFFRGTARRHSGKVSAAVADMADAIKYGWTPRILAEEALAESFFELKDFAHAFDFYKSITLADPSDVHRFTRPIALAINHLDKPDVALQLAKRALETHPNNPTAENLLGWAYLANDDILSAREHIQKALKGDPQLAAAYLNLGQLEARIGATAAALKDFEKAMSLAQAQGDDSIYQTALDLRDATAEGVTVEAPLGSSLNQKSAIPSLSLE